jgi:hypothetical protein
LNRQALNTNLTTGYLAAWNASFGEGPAYLPPGCTAGKYCPDYGPPLDYLSANGDGALGGNPAFTPYLKGDIVPPQPGEEGWKDTASVSAGQVIRLMVRWTPSDVPVIPYHTYGGDNLYDFDPTEGYYVWHCHLLTHEDNEMMRPYRVTK